MFRVLSTWKDVELNNLFEIIIIVFKLGVVFVSVVFLN